MKKVILSAFSRAAMTFAMIVSLVFIFTAFSGFASAQANQLMLADILIALRSKKVTLPERNKILADAVIVRGVTFSLTPEIEKELEDTGADKTLIDSIRQKSHMVKASAIVAPPVETKPKAEPAPDFSFYAKRADSSLSKGEFDSAAADYTKALDMNPKSPEAFLGRGLAYINKQHYDLAIADFDKSIELKPQNPTAYANRGDAFEKKGDKAKAVADYDKALDLGATNETTKTGAARLHAEEAKAAEAAKALEEAKKPSPVVAKPTETVAPAPEFIDLGVLSKESATRLTMPAYPLMASKAHIGGKVIVNVTFDEEGNVTSAKVGSGPQLLKQAAEDAAIKSKFKPVTFQNKPIKARGFIVYNFTPQGN